MKVTLKDLVPLKKSGIYAFINEEDKKIHISYTEDMCGTLFKVLVKPEKYHFKDDILKGDLVLLEDRPFSRSLKKRVLELYAKYELDGYTPYRRFTPPKFTIKVRTVQMEGKYYSAAVISYVRSKQKEVVGVFTKAMFAHEFIDTQYKKGREKVIYAENELTRQYRRGVIG